jgi:hypothetical protein
MMLTGPIRNSDICYTRVHLFLKAQVRFFGIIINKRNQKVAYILRNVQDKALDKTSTITTEGQAMTSHPMNYFKTISKSVLQPDYCAVKRPPPPISFVKNA